MNGSEWPEDLFFEPAFTHLNIGATLLETGKYEEAIASFEAAQETHDQPSGYIQTVIGHAYSLLGHHEEAIKHYDNAIKIRDAPLHRAMRGTEYATHGRCAEATADAETALSMDSYSEPGYHTSAQAHWILAACLENEQAQLHMDQALNIARAHGYTQEDIDFSLEAVEAWRTLKKISQPTTTDDEARIIPNPAQRHLELKQLMLRQTNQHRAEAGAPPVRMGTNPAAQIHAEEALKGCYSSHWDRWGMKPNHRYTLTGGTGADGENGLGLDFCIRQGHNYAPNRPMETQVPKAVQEWMDSPGHRRNMLNPAHTVLNIGIAWDKYNTNMIQQFSSDYIHYEVRPNISPDGILRLSGQVSGATLQIDDSVNIQIRWDPPLKPLTQGQLANTYALCNPRQVGYVVEPLPPNWSYIEPEIETKTQEHPCVDPYQTNPSRPSPANPEEAHQAWADAKQASSAAPPITVETRRIIAELMDVSSSKFNIQANLTPILTKNGPGIYSIMMWGRPLHMSKSTPLSEQSIFWQTDPPANSPYSQTWSPVPASITQTPAPQPPTQTPTRTPAPIPLNIHARTVDQYSYSMEFPPGWTPEQKSDGYTTFLSPQGTAGAAIHIWITNSDDATNLYDLLNERNKELLERIRTAAEKGDSAVFKMKPNRPPPAGVKKQLWQAWQMEYRWRESPEECIRDVVDIISPSNSYTHGVLISTWICEKDLDERAKNERQKMLTSFREKDIRTR